MRAEGPMDLSAALGDADRLHRSFASLRMTSFTGTRDLTAGLNQRSLVDRTSRLGWFRRIALASRPAASLDVTLVDRDIDRLAVSSGSTPLNHRVKAIFPEAVVFLPLSLDEPQISAFGEDPLASRVPLHGGVMSSRDPVVGWLLRIAAADRNARRELCRKVGRDHDRCKQRA